MEIEMDPLGITSSPATAAAMANGPPTQAFASSARHSRNVDESSDAGPQVFVSPSAAILPLVLAATEGFRTVSELGRDAEETATATAGDVGHKQTPGTDPAHGLDLYA